MDFFRKAGDIWRSADRALGGWLPGGGTASPFTRSKQEGERKMQAQYEQMLDKQSAKSDYVGKPGRFAGEGQIANIIRATTEAGVNPINIALGDSDSVRKLSNYYQKFPDVTNQYDLNTNLFLRYLSGVGAEGLKISPELGKQLYSDIKQQESKFQDPSYRREQLESPWNPSFMKTNIASGKTPVYYGGLSDAIAPNKALLATNIGDRWQLERSIGSFWAEPSQSGPDYSIKNERYNFSYAPKTKEGENFGQGAFFAPVSPVNVGRRLVQKGYGKPFAYNLNVKPTGEVNVQ